MYTEAASRLPPGLATKPGARLVARRPNAAQGVVGLDPQLVAGGGVRASADPGWVGFEDEFATQNAYRRG